MAKKNKSPSKSKLPNNGGGGKSSSNGVTASTKKTNSGLSSSSPWNVFHIVVALISLCLGIIAPSILSGDGNSGSPQQQRSRRGLFQQNPDGGDNTQSFQPKFICDERALGEYLHDVPIKGLHVVCAQNGKFTFYREAQIGNSNTITIEKEDNHNNNIPDWGSLKPYLISNLLLTSEDELHQPWAVFSPAGHRLLLENSPPDANIDLLGDLGMFLVFQGGQWLWPGVRKGYTRTIRLDDGNNATLETLSLFPLVISVKGFLSDEECTYIQKRAEPDMKHSVVSLMDHDKGREDADFRTSQTTFLSSTNSPPLQEIDDRTASLVRMPRAHQEHVQVLRYGHTQNYVTHHDYFHPNLYSQDPKTLTLIQNGRRNRMATVFWYLSDVEEGGHTVFPRFDKGPQPPKADTWDIGLKVKPERGKVIIFYSMTPDGELDEYSLHGAAPVGKDNIKWAANKWVWNMPMGYTK